jgi:hypothetical protein
MNEHSDRDKTEPPAVISAPTGCPPWEHDVSLCGKYFQTKPTPDRISAQAKRQTRASFALARDDEPCLCDTDFTCMADHEEAELRAEVERLKRNTAGLYARAHAAEAKVARVRSLMAHLHTDLVHISDLRAALEA